MIEMVARRRIAPEAFDDEATTTIKEEEKGSGARLGRPPGAISKEKVILNNLLSNRVNYSQDLPHEFLLRIVRGEKIMVSAPDDPEPKYEIPNLDQRMRCAKDAAPYFAPRLSSVEVIQNLSDADLEAIITGAAAQAGVNITINQDGQVANIQAGTSSVAGMTLPRAMKELTNG